MISRNVGDGEKWSIDQQAKPVDAALESGGGVGPGRHLRMVSSPLGIILPFELRGV